MSFNHNFNFESMDNDPFFNDGNCFYNRGSNRSQSQQVMSFMGSNSAFSDAFNDPFFNDPFFNIPFSQQITPRLRGNPRNHTNNSMINRFMGQRDHLENVFDNDGFFFPTNRNQGFSFSGNQTNIQVEAFNDHYGLSLQVNNLDKTSLDLNVDPLTRKVTVSGSINVRNQSSSYSESFVKSITLPGDNEKVLDDINTTVVYQNGILRIDIPFRSRRFIKRESEPKFITGRIEEIED